MPGVIMDNASVNGLKQRQGSYEWNNGVASPQTALDRMSSSHEPRNGIKSVNGAVKALDDAGRENVPSLPHITHGFFPLAQLVNRLVQQCWNDLSDMITELADVHVPTQDESSQSVIVGNKLLGNQSAENIRKKLRILEFAHAKRAEFIKLLVLSQWSRQAADVSKLIDLQAFIRSRHEAYNTAIQSMGNMKQDLVRAQIANPDLKTALEVLAKGKVSIMPNLGYTPPRPLSARKALKKLRQMNRIISTRLVLNDQIPSSFRTYRVHDGRVTFVIAEEFALDLSIAEENMSSQFFFVDIRFLFTPSSPILKGRVLNELELKINGVLRARGLTGCFEMLHNLVLTNKVHTLFKQAIEMSRGLWQDTLRVELLHRTLVVQYWTSRPGSKSWIEIGIDSGRRHLPPDRHDRAVSFLRLRWMRDGKQVDSDEIQFDTKSLSMEHILRSVIALHISHILYSVYARLGEGILFSRNTLSLRAQLSRTEPGDCHLEVQLTRSSNLRVTVEPISGTNILSATSAALERPDSDRSSAEKPAVEELVTRVSRVRCSAAMEEIESKAKILGFEIVTPGALKLDVRRIFHPNVLRFSFFSHRLWDRNWVLAATSSMDGDSWWTVQLRRAALTNTGSEFVAGSQSQSTVRSIQVVSNTLMMQQRLNQSSFADLGYCLAGILTMHANARFLAESQCASFYPPLDKLQFGRDFQVPNLFVRYNAASLPQAVRMKVAIRLPGESYVDETIRLVFQGVDSLQKAAIIVAYGSLKSRMTSLAYLVLKADASLVFQPRGNNFAIRLLAPPGRPVIISLVERLQRLECMLSVFECLRRRKIAVQKFSLAEIGFKYTDSDLVANIGITVPDLDSATVPEPDELASRAESLIQASLSITFDRRNPHRRIQGAITARLNKDSLSANLDYVIELLFVTLPALRALDMITSNISRKELQTVQVTTRSPSHFIIKYPKHRYAFELRLDKHADYVIWVLKDVSGQQDRSGQAHIVSALQERLYNAKGDGWRGLGNGVVAHILDKVFDIILQLHASLTSSDVPPNEELKTVPKAEHENAINNEPTSETRVGKDSVVSDNQLASKPAQTQCKPNDDVIMID